MIPNKRSVGRAVQLLYFKSCLRCNFFGFLNFAIFGRFRTKQPEEASSFLFMHLKTLMRLFDIHNPNISVIEAKLGVKQRR